MRVANSPLFRPFKCRGLVPHDVGSIVAKFWVALSLKCQNCEIKSHVKIMMYSKTWVCDIAVSLIIPLNQAVITSESYFIL